MSTGTLYDNVWSQHTVRELPTGETQLFVGLHLIHEVTSPQAFGMLEERDLDVAFPDRTFATTDHIIPTADLERPFGDDQAETMLRELEENTEEYDITFFDPTSGAQGIVHVVGPEQGLTQPGMTIVCGDSHTSTHGAFGTLGFGIGTSQIRDVLATQCIAMEKQDVRRIQVNGTLGDGVYAKDIILKIIGELGVEGGIGYVYEYGGPAIEALDMEGGYRVSPEQLMGLEVNPRAAQIADVVLWIGYLQWHFRTHGDADRLDPPLLDDIDNIQTRDAVLAYDEKTPRTDEDGEPVTMWDRRTYKEDPTTGERVPDESAQVPVYDYENPEPATWPEADFIVGNPPFIGNKRMRDALGNGYTEAVRDAYAYKVRKDSDFVMYWWYKAAKAVRGKLDEWSDEAERFGLITTNSIRQVSNRKSIKKQMEANPPVSLVFAIPDHPWVASADGSDVRIAMTVGAVTDQPGTLQTVTREKQAKGIHWDVQLTDKTGSIQSDLTVGADVAGAESLEANEDLSYMGVIPVGLGFRIDQEEIEDTGYSLGSLPPVIRPYLNGKDVANNRPVRYIIDFFGLDKEEARDQYPELYQRVRDRVKPKRDEVRRKNHRDYWWIFGEARPAMRNALSDLDRYIATVETSKHHYFVFLPEKILPDQKLRVVASDEAFHFGVLSSRIHEVWALAAGGRQGVGNDPVYNNTRCFDPFPFPAAPESQKATIRDLGAQLDAHRNERLDAHDDLTMTALYNVLKKERRGEDLDADERTIHEQGLVGVLKELHDELDAAVAAAYGWDAGLPEETILQRLVDLNAERRAEEEEGHVRYLRPEYQAPETVETQAELELDVEIGGDGAPTEPLDWPSGLKARAQVVRAVMTHADEPLTVEEVAQHFHRARRSDVRELLETLEALGHVGAINDGAYAT